MTLIEYCITVGLLSCILSLGLEASTSFYQNALFQSQKIVIVDALQEAQNKVFSTGISETIYLNKLQEISPSITINGPASLSFNTDGSLSIDAAYTLSYASYSSAIIIKSDGSIL